MVKYAFPISCSFQWQRRFQESTELIAETQELCRKATQVLNNKYVDLDKPKSGAPGTVSRPRIARILFEFWKFMLRSPVYVVWPSVSSLSNLQVLNIQNKSSEKDLHTIYTIQYISANFCISGLASG